VLRNIAEAAAYYPDASPVKAYLAAKVVNNLNWLRDLANSFKTPDNPLWIVYAWTKYDRPEGPQYFANWENNYVAYAIDRAIKLGFATDNAYRDAVNDLQLKFFTSEPAYPRFEGAPYAIPYGTTDGTQIQGPTTYFTTMAQFVPGVVDLGNHRDFAGYYGPEARIAIMEARERGGAGAQAAYDYLWPFIGTGAEFCSTNNSSNVPYLACRAGFAMDPYPAVAADLPPVPCASWLPSAETTLPSIAGPALVNVTSSAPSCPWTAVSNTTWITITGGASGSGTGSVGYLVAANTSDTPRTGTLTIAGATYTVTQNGILPLITAQPQDQTVSFGQPATLRVTATGSTAYQWYLGASPTTPNPIAGGNGSTFATGALENTKRYWVRASNPSGTVDSATATVSVAFTDSLAVGVVSIRIVHIVELRIRIDAARVARGLNAYPWTDPLLVAGGTPAPAGALFRGARSVLGA